MRLHPEFPRTPSPSVGGVRILLLEDDAVFAELVRDSLRRLASGELAIEHVTTLRDALARLKAGAYDLILTDLSVPDSRGLDTLAGLAAATDRLICVLTGEQDPGLREAALALGAYDLFSKDRLPAQDLDRLVRLAVMQARALGSVRRSEARLRAIVEAEPECVKLMDEQCRLIEMNPAGLGMVEAASVDALRGRCLLDLVGAEHRAGFAEMARRVADGRPATLEFEIRGLKGTPRWLETHAVPLREDGSERALVLSITRDITERRRAQEAGLRFERAARALAAANEAILKAKTEAALFDRACEIAVEVGGFILGAVLRLEADGRFTRVAAKGRGARFPEPVRYSMDAGIAEGRGLIGAACRMRRPMISNDYASDPRIGLVRRHLEYSVGSAAVFPLYCDGEIVGVYGLRHEAPGAFTDELTALLSRLADNISFALTGFRREAERARVEQVRQLEHAVTGHLAGAAGLEAGVEGVLRLVCEAHDWTVGRLWRADDAAGVLRFLATWAASPDERAHSIAASQALEFRRGAGLAGRVWESGEPLWVSDSTLDPRVIGSRLARRGEARGLFLFPVTADGKVIGVASFASPGVREPDARLRQAVQVIGAQLGQFLQRQDAERVLRESEARFRRLTELSSDWYWEQDAELRFTSVSTALTVDGRPVAHLVGKRRQDLGYVGPTEAQWNAHLSDLAARRPFRDFQYARALEDGTLLWMSISGEPVFDENGGFRGYRGVGSNITEKKREERLRVLETSIARELSSAKPAPEVLKAVLVAICEQGSFECGRYFELDGETMRFREGCAFDPDMARFVEGSRELRFAPGAGLVGLVWKSGETLWSADAARDPRVQAKNLASALGVHGTLVVPVSSEGRVIGVLSVSTRRVREPEPSLVDALRVAGAQIGQYLERKQREAALDRFRTALDRSADMVLLVDLRSGKLIDFNETACYLLGYRRDELLGGPATSIVADLSVAQLIDSQRALSERPGRTDLVVRVYRRKDGSRFEVEVLRKIVDAREGPILLLNARDLTERRRIEERQAAHLRYQESTARLGRSALGRRDAGELIDDALQTLKDGLGCEVVAYKNALPENWRGAYASGLAEAVTAEQGERGVLYALSAKENAFGPEEAGFLAATASVLSAGLLRIDSEQRLAFLAQYDGLTGLPNRALLHDRFTQLITQARRRGGALGLLFIDLDDFKLVNDTLGHAAGDALLREVGDRLQGAVRLGDTVARVAGDEFAVVLGSLARQEDAALVAQKILDALAAPTRVAGQEMFVTASLGIALFPSDGEDAEALLAAADAAMYRAKQAGRSGYQFFTAEINQRTRARAQLGSQLRRALERNEFTLAYQPKYDLRAGLPCGAEALLRWRRPDGAYVSPAQFIPVLEETGLIVSAGEWVVRQACADLKAWQAEGLEVVPVAVNLSARQFRQQDLDGRIHSLLLMDGVDPALVDLEITESQLMQDPEHAIRVMRSLHEAGMRIAIDDFGTGYSSLSYLTRFPVSALKIDRSFVARVPEDPAAAAIVRTITDMAHTLGFVVVAEGVETEAQAALLRSLGCEQAQGYLFARPMPAAHFRALIASGTVAARAKSRRAARYR